MSQSEPLQPTSAGQMLATARHQQGLEISEISACLNLGNAIIQQLESDDWSHLPAAYSRGYARSYARRLKLNMVEFEDALRRLQVSLPPVKSVFGNPPARRTGSARGLRILSYLVASVFVVLPLIWTYTHFALDWTQNKPVDKGLAAEQFRQSNHIQAAMVENPLATENFSQAGELLEIQLSADSWVSIHDAEGRPLEGSLLKGGSSHSYHGNGPFSLQVGRVSAIQIRINGQDFKVPEGGTTDVASFKVSADLDS